MDKKDLDQIVSAVTESVEASMGARIDAIEAKMNSMAEGEEVVAAPAPEEPEPEPDANDPDADAVDAPEATGDPVNEPEAEPAPSNDLSAAGMTPTDIAEFRQFQADKAAASRTAEIRKEVDAVMATRKHSITPAPPAKASAKESQGTDPRATYAKQFADETGIDFDLAFAPASKKSRMLTVSETQLKNKFLRQHGPPKSAA